MAGSIEGARKARDTNIRKYGPDFFRNMGRTGGLAKNPNKGFGSDRERASEAGRKGGTNSRRPKSEKNI